MQQKQPKSWELRKKDPKKYRFFDESDKTLIKKPGDIDGEQFVLRNCVRCTILLLDYSATILIDDCIDCKFFFGPCESSLFIRGSKKCRIVACCGQFRSKKCQDIEMLLFSQSQPIIELSARMGFGCFRGYYPQLAEHLQKAKLNRWNNTWSDVFDFNPSLQGPNFYLLLEDTRYEDFLPPLGEILQFEGETKTSVQIVPFTSESRNKVFIDEVLLIFQPNIMLDYNQLSNAFQPVLNEAPQKIFMEEEEEETDEVVIEAPEQQYCYLVKSKFQALFADNYEPFKKALEEYQIQLNGYIIEYRLQPIFSLHIRTDNRDVSLLSYLNSLIDVRLGVKMRDVCVVVQNKEQIEQLGSLLFANMKDEREK